MGHVDGEKYRMGVYRSATIKAKRGERMRSMILMKIMCGSRQAGCSNAYYVWQTMFSNSKIGGRGILSILILPLTIVPIIYFWYRKRFPLSRHLFSSPFSFHLTCAPMRDTWATCVLFLSSKLITL